LSIVSLTRKLRMDKAYSDSLPANAEDSERLYDAMPVYRHVAAGQLVMEQITESDFNEDALFANGNMFAEIPAYGKISKFTETFAKDQALTILVPSKSEEFDGHSQLPVYDPCDIFPLESTHIRVNINNNDNLSKELSLNKHAVAEVFETAIRTYLKEHQQTIKYQIEETCMLGIHKNPNAGFFKCTTGLLNNDLSCGNEYVCFVIQVYKELEAGNVIIEWQRRRGDNKIFHGLFQHFQTVIMTYLLSTKASIVPNQKDGYIMEALNSAAKVISSRKSRRNSPVLNSSDLISPNGHVDLFNQLASVC